MRRTVAILFGIGLFPTLPIRGARQKWGCPSKSYLIGLDAQDQPMCRRIKNADECTERCTWETSCHQIKRSQSRVYLRSFEPGAAEPVQCCQMAAIRATQCDTVPWHRGLMVDEHADELIRDITMRGNDYAYDYSYGDYDMHTAEPSVATVCRFTRAAGGCGDVIKVTRPPPVRATTARRRASVRVDVEVERRPGGRILPYNYREWEAKAKRDRQPYWCKGPLCAPAMRGGRYQPPKRPMHVHRPSRTTPKGWG